MAGRKRRVVGGIVVVATVLVVCFAIAVPRLLQSFQVVVDDEDHGDGYLTWGGSDGENGNGVAAATDGVYLAGDTYSFGAGNYDAFLAKYASNGSQLWNRTWGGTSGENGHGVAVATDGVYLAGDTGSFGAGGYSAFLAKYASNGTQLWNRTWGGSSVDSGNSVAVATDGVYLAGDTSSFGTGQVDAFLAKYTSDGTQLWNRTWGGTSGEYESSVAVATDGVYLAGDTSSFGTGQADAFLAKYTSNGTQLWNRTWGGVVYDSGRGVAVATDGVYLAGETDGFGAGWVDAFLVKYASNGTQLWNRTWGGADGEQGHGVAVAIDGVYLAGYTSSFGTGWSNAFLAKYALNGTQLWNRTWGGTYSENGNGVAVATDGIYLAGDTYSFGIGGLVDAFLAKYDTAGNQPLTISQPADVFTVYPVGNSITWIITGTTTSARSFTIYRDGIEVSAGSWEPGAAVRWRLDGLGLGTYTITLVARDGIRELVWDNVVVTIGADPAMAFIVVMIGVVALAVIVAAVVLHSKSKAITSRLRSMRNKIDGQVRAMRETIAAKQQVPGTVDEVVYRRPKQEPPAQRPVVPPATPTSLATATCRACGQPVPKGAEKGRFCVYCGKEMA